MPEEQYIRKVQTSVTVFVRCGDEYLMLRRSPTKRVDPGRLNGVGGRLEPGEDYLSAAIRETEEETGYVLSPPNMKLAAVVKLEGGYQEDWVMCFFTADVPDKIIPGGEMLGDEELMWIHKDRVLGSEYELVDDLNYCFKEIAEGGQLLFLTCRLDDQQKVTHADISRLALPR